MPKLLDLTGNVFGKLTVVERRGSDKQGRSLWFCLCDCGNTIISKSRHLTKGDTKSCGCLKKHGDLQGLHFGRLTVIELHSTGKHTFWKCACDCGKIFIVSTGNLCSGRTISCGCFKSDLLHSSKKSKYLAGFNRVHRGYKNGARVRGYSFELSEDFCFNIMQLSCDYCCKPPMNRAVELGDIFYYNGIDRVDNSKGYVENNVVPCCKVCNRAKDTMSRDEFLEWIKQVYESSVCKS